MPEKILEKKALINGKWVESESGERFEVHYPGDGRVVGTAPICTRKDVQRAVAAARQGQQALAKLLFQQRHRHFAFAEALHLDLGLSLGQLLVDLVVKLRCFDGDGIAALEAFIECFGHLHNV